jgi:hypothetical protein
MEERKDVVSDGSVNVPRHLDAKISNSAHLLVDLIHEATLRLRLKAASDEDKLSSKRARCLAFQWLGLALYALADVDSICLSQRTRTDWLQVATLGTMLKSHHMVAAAYGALADLEPNASVRALFAERQAQLSQVSTGTSSWPYYMLSPLGRARVSTQTLVRALALPVGIELNASLVDRGGLGLFASRALSDGALVLQDEQPMAVVFDAAQCCWCCGCALAPHATSVHHTASALGTFCGPGSIYFGYLSICP